MPRLSSPKISHLQEGDTFHYNSRELPVYAGCENQKGWYYCIHHKEGLFGEQPKDEHIEKAATHVIVYYCEFHKRFEEV
jgi:hypothetical protein